MTIRNFTSLLALCMSLLAPAAHAEGLAIPDNEQRQGMSYAEYAKHREEMRQRMRTSTKDEHLQVQDSSIQAVEKTEQPSEDSAYGQGYGAREHAENKPDRIRQGRPERPQGRFSREGMGRR